MIETLIQIAYPILAGLLFLSACIVSGQAAQVLADWVNKRKGIK